MKNHYRDWDCLKRGAWALWGFNEELDKKKGGGVFEGGLIPQWTL